MSSVYQINKGVGRPIEFRGLKAQYIWWLGGGVLGCLFVFALLYIAGVSLMVCVPFVLGIGGWWFWFVYRVNARYGEHGFMKAIAKKQIPTAVKCRGKINLKIQRV